MRRHPPMQRTASGMQHQPQATEGFRDTLNPKLLCLATSGPRRDVHRTWRPPMRQSAWRKCERCWARVDKPASLFNSLYPTPNARSHDKNLTNQTWNAVLSCLCERKSAISELSPNTGAHRLHSRRGATGGEV